MFFFCYSAAVITAYLMRTEHLSLEGVKPILCLKSSGTTRLVHASSFLLIILTMIFSLLIKHTY